MTNLIEQGMPDYLTQYVPEGASLDDFMIEGALPIATLSIDMKRFTARYRKNTQVFKDHEGRNMQTFDCVILEANKNLTKTYYGADFNRDNPNTKPICTSLDSLEPDPNVLEKQFDNCVQCPKNKFGSGKMGKGKACQDNKRIAVVPMGDIPNVAWGGPMLLRLPPTSLAPYTLYIESLGRRTPPTMPYLLITRLSFDPDAQLRLLFERVRWVTQEEAEQVKQHLGTPQLERVLYISGSGGGGGALNRQEADSEAPPHGATSVPPTVQAQPPTQDQANRAAAARAAQEALAVEAELEEAALAKANREAAAAAAAAVKPQAPPAFAPSTDHVGNGHDKPNLATNRTEVEALNGPTVLPAQPTAEEAAVVAKAAAMARLAAAMADLEKFNAPAAPAPAPVAVEEPAEEVAAVDNAMIGTSELLGILDQRASIPD